MKRVYCKPVLEIEAYNLSASIASHCGIVVHNGPEAIGHKQCDDYVDIFNFAIRPGISVQSLPHNVMFYDDTSCDCYTTGGDYGYWTS